MSKKSKSKAVEPEVVDLPNVVEEVNLPVLTDEVEVVEAVLEKRLFE